MNDRNAPDPYQGLGSSDSWWSVGKHLKHGAGSADGWCRASSAVRSRAPRGRRGGW